MQTQRTRKPAAARKAEIVETAIRLSTEFGPDRLTTERLAREIGISQAAIFRHFSTKSQIWLAVGEHIAVKMKTTTALDKNAFEQPLEALRNLLKRQVAFFEQTPAIPAIMFSQELHAENQQLRQHVAALLHDRQDIFTRLIKKAQMLGQLNPELSADDGAILLLACLQGLAMRWSITAGSFDLVPEGVRLVDMLIDGFGPAH